MSLKGKVIAITGGASGIGLATALLIASRGATVCIADIAPSSLSEAETHLKTHNNPYLVTQVDVTKRAEVDGWIDSIVEKFGQLDGAANCAGVIGKHHGIRPVAELEDEEWDKIIAVNLTGLMYSLRAELRKIADFGSIVNIASIQGVMGFAGSGAYSATKHGVIGLTRCAAKEVGNREIRVNAVAPGAIVTPLLKVAEEINPNEARKADTTAIKRQGKAEEIAAIIAFLLGAESSFVTGSVYGGDGGWDC